MGMTICEKILARVSNRNIVKPDEYIWVKVDRIGLSSSYFFKQLEALNVENVFNPDKIYATDDHSVPASSIEMANLSVQMRTFAKKYKIKNYFDIGRHGIQHELFPNYGFVNPGDFIVSDDSHCTSLGCFNAAACSVFEEIIYILLTGKLWLRVPHSIRFEFSGSLPGCEQFVVGMDLMLYIAKEYGIDIGMYKSIEFEGDGISTISIPSRFAMSNMSAEFGAKFAIFPCDNLTLEYLIGKTIHPHKPVTPDIDAKYDALYKFDISNLSPHVALPHSLSNSVSIDQVVSKKIEITQAFIGSCTNGRLEDFRMASLILKGRHINPNVRLIVTPASQIIWQECLEEGIWSIFAEAGAVITNSSCGACNGIHLGVLGDGEVCISTSNRNCKGRMGSSKSFIFLANAATVAASAITGYITDPRQFL